MAGEMEVSVCPAATWGGVGTTGGTVLDNWLCAGGWLEAAVARLCLACK